MISPEEFERVLPGVQLAAFELLWATVPELEVVFARTDVGGIQIRCVPAMTLDEETACREIVSEIFSEALPGTACAVTFEAPENPAQWQRVISYDLFRAIAQEVAPWRLESGR